MITEKIKELEAAKAKVAELEQKIASECTAELAALPEKFGYDNVNAFIRAVRAAAGGANGRKRKSAGKAQKKTRTRAKITDETRTDVKKLVEAGKTGLEIAKSLGISLPSVQNIKKALGLVKARG